MQNEYLDETIEMALLPNRGNEAPEPIDEVAEGDWKTRQVGGAHVILHMPGTKLYTDASCFDDIDAAEFLPSDTYVPVTHKEMANEMEFAIEAYLNREGVYVKDRVFAVGKGKTRDGKQKDGGRAFGLWNLTLDSGDGDHHFSAVLGIQNALDGSARAMAAAGHKMTVCDNLAFSGELMKAHRHSKNVVKEILGSIMDIVRKVPERFFADADLQDHLRSMTLTANEGYKIMSQLAAMGAFANIDQYKKAVKQLECPSYGVFARDQSYWRAYNAATYGAGRRTSPMALIGATNIIDNHFRTLAGV